MDQDIVRQLASQPPPPLRKFEFSRAKEAQTEITKLEALLGAEPSPKTYNIVSLNSRVAQLRSLLAAKIAAPSLSALHGRERFLASCARDAAAKPKTQNHPALHGRARFIAAAKVLNFQKI